MLTRTLSALLRLRVTVTYAVTLVAVATTLLMCGPRTPNLHNLGHGRVVTLLGSAFVTADGPMWIWLPGLVCLLGWRNCCGAAGRC